MAARFAATQGKAPESGSATAQQHYDDVESLRYDRCAQVRRKQSQLTERALALLGCWRGGSGGDDAASTSRPAFVLDLGCGSALSGAALSARGVQWLGLDVSAAMLRLAAAKLSGGDGDSSRGGDVALADLSHGLPLRATTTPLFDGAISISALQWLLVAAEDDDDGDADAAARRHVHALLAPLRAALGPRARAALQCYVPDAGAADLLLRGASAAGFAAAALVADHPHHTRAVKYYIVAEAPGGGDGDEEEDGELTAALQRERGCGGDGEAPPECALAGHIGGTCCRWWRRAVDGGEGDGGASTTSTAVSDGGEWSATCHRVHARKVVRLMWRGASGGCTPATTCLSDVSADDAHAHLLHVAADALAPANLCCGIAHVQLLAEPAALSAAGLPPDEPPDELLQRRDGGDSNSTAPILSPSCEQHARAVCEALLAQLQTGGGVNGDGAAFETFELHRVQRLQRGAALAGGEGGCGKPLAVWPVLELLLDDGAAAATFGRGCEAHALLLDRFPPHLVLSCARAAPGELVGALRSLLRAAAGARLSVVGVHALLGARGGRVMVGCYPAARGAALAGAARDALRCFDCDAG